MAQPQSGPGIVSLWCSWVLWSLGHFHTVPAGVSTVREVSVQRGGSVTIPCFYDDRYKTHVKYWCRGFSMSSCTPIVHSDSPQEGKVSIRDDPHQPVFTVTINNLTVGDSDFYSCGVKIFGDLDVGDQVSLSVIDGKMFLWCKIGGFCASERSVSLDGRPVLIRDDTVNKIVSVTMRGLKRKDTGWYWCDAGGWQIPVHITVKPITITECK
uniref:Ig-like domain-containing protein n=1 Tax=Paramormyrops kingsleyae TaxID=1676925 RepID=A0A3B3RT70_9TELE